MIKNYTSEFCFVSYCSENEQLKNCSACNTNRDKNFIILFFLFQLRDLLTEYAKGLSQQLTIQVNGKPIADDDDEYESKNSVNSLCI